MSEAKEAGITGPSRGAKPLTYRDAGVDLAAGDELVERIKKLARSTFGPRVLGDLGGFGGLYALGGRVDLFTRLLDDPVLVACADGVGTKLKIAFQTGIHHTVGIDAVAMNVNDLVVQGAEPLFFLDYFACGKLEPEVAEKVIAGVAVGCKQAHCALLGGETAELPDLYQPGEYDLAGFCVGIVERGKVVDGHKVVPGDVIIGLFSSGLHSNGFSLVRRVLLQGAKLSLEAHLAELGRPLGEELLEPTRIYVDAALDQIAYYQVKENIKSLAHITGGGLPGNVARTLPPGTAALFRKDSWEVPPIFRLIEKLGPVEEEEMFRTFNMGIGMTLVTSEYYAEAIRSRLEKDGYPSAIVGEIVEGQGEVLLV